ncbi:uncharacterized protein LOC128955021 [Oppia nitens]|uniref:uncharacterized protein LOC128955021 n=1 Tax=Oppia nitens TaxID=1686743 RepID=UPI0023DAB90A|nr:uncharacterized protein LOC128955021 [Oppia nitens]
MSALKIPLNRYPCLRSAALTDNNNGNTIDNGLDMIDLKKRCIKSIAYVIRPTIKDNCIVSGTGTGVFVVDNRLLLTCYHVVKHRPVVWVQCVAMYWNQLVMTTPLIEADVVYVEPHWDLALVRLHELPSQPYKMLTTMPMTTSPESTDFGAPVAMLGHGNSILFTLHPGMITTPRVPQHNLIPAKHDASSVAYFSELPVITHDTIVAAGFSGCPLIDTDGRLSGLLWGGILECGQVALAVDYKILTEFITKALTYERDGLKQISYGERYVLDNRDSDKRLLGLIFSTQPFSGSFTVRSVLPTVLDETKSIIGSRVTKVFEHVFNNIDVIRSAIGSNRVIKLSIGLPTDDDNSSGGGSQGTTVINDSISSININTIAPVDNHGFRIKPLVF